MAGASLDRRRLMDEFTAWASRFGRIGPDAIGRKQISRNLLSLAAWEDYFWEQRDPSSGHHAIRAEPDQVRGTQIRMSGFDGAGAYEISWKVSGQVYSDLTWFIYGFPFIGGKPLSGDFQCVSMPYGLGYHTPGMNYFPNGVEISLSGTAVVTINEDSPMYGGVMVGANPGGVFNTDYASVSLRKVRNT